MTFWRVTIVAETAARPLSAAALCFGIALVSLMLSPLVLSSPAFADGNSSSLVSNECALSGNATALMSACANGGGGNPVGINTTVNAITTTGYSGVEANAVTAVLPVNVWSACRWVDNSGGAVFAPFNTSGEWTAFIGSHPSAVTLEDCALPATVSGAPATVAVTPVYATGGAYPGSTAITVSNPNVYGRYYSLGNSLNSVWPATPENISFSTHGGATIVGSSLQWNAADSSNPATYAINGNALSWLQNFKFGPDVTLTALDTSVSGSVAGSNISIISGDSVQLTWAATSTYGTIKSNVPGGGAWNGVSGAIVQPTVTTTYTMTSTDSNGLVSVATAIVTVGAAPAQCGSNVQVNSSGAITNNSAACNVGTVSAINGTSGAYTCTSGSNVANCTAQSSSSCVPGPVDTAIACGAASGASTSTAPTANLCSDSSTPTVTQNGSNWNWTCGTASTCSAPVTAVAAAPNCLTSTSTTALLCSYHSGTEYYTLSSSPTNLEWQSTNIVIGTATGSGVAYVTNPGDGGAPVNVPDGLLILNGSGLNYTAGNNGPGVGVNSSGSNNVIDTEARNTCVAVCGTNNDVTFDGGDTVYLNVTSNNTITSSNLGGINTIEVDGGGTNTINLGSDTITINGGNVVINFANGASNSIVTYNGTSANGNVTINAAGTDSAMTVHFNGFAGNVLTINDPSFVSSTGSSKLYAPGLTTISSVPFTYVMP